MIAILQSLLDIIGMVWSGVTPWLVPASLGAINIIHVAIWTPVIVGLLIMTRSTIQRLTPRQIRTARPLNAPAPILGKSEDKPKTKRAKGKRRRTKARAAKLREDERESRAKQAAQKAAEAAEAATRAAERAKAQEEAKATRAAEAATRAAERAKAQEEAKAQRAAQKATEAAQRAVTRAKAQEEAKATRAVEAAQRAVIRAKAQEEAKATRAAERAERAAQIAELKALRAAQKVTQRDPTTRAFGADPNRVYEFRYRVVPLDSLITSNTDSGAINPAYDSALQPRQRGRAASQRQIDQLAANLVPESLLWDFRTLDKGAMIVGDDLMVESGNGRALALRKARQLHPAQWEHYQRSLRENLDAAGLAADSLEGVDSPVLVRERVTVVDRAAFAREANAPPVLQMSTLEVARVDAGRITGDMVGQMTVREGQSIDQALRTKANADFVRSFIGTMSENEAALLQRKDGTLAQAGIRRIKAAMFVRTFEGESGERLAETFLEALDSDIKNFETAISASLPVLARAETLIGTGDRAADLSMADDISKSLDMLARLREADTISVSMYVGQSTLEERETTAFQDELLIYFDEIGRSPKKIREFLNSYAAAVEDAPHPDQVDLFGESLSPSKESVFERITGRKIAVRS
jgi:chemotaxis protein histidine kinase CheA